MSVSGESIELLLADPRELRPVLEDGLPAAATELVPRPRKDETQLRRRRDKDRSDLREQRWGLVVPEGREGNALLEALGPLIAFRREEQGAEPMVFRASPGMDRKRSKNWIDQVYEAERIDEHDRPLYLCLLGSPEQVSFELQHALGHHAYVGRVHFDQPAGDVDLEGYAAYAEKVVRYARAGTAHEPPNLLYYVAPDGSRATRNALSRLVAPSIDDSQRLVGKGKLTTSSVRAIEGATVEAFLQSTAAERPSVLLSVSHGLGGPREGFKSFEEQRRVQGAMVLGTQEVLDAERMLGKTFLPGGLWLFFACFGAGTPAASEYHKWLTLLAEAGAYREPASAVLSALATSGSGFLAALPQAALRNPRGPLAAIGHVDLAWNYAYTNHSNSSESRSARFTRVLQTMARGARIGAAHDELMEGFRTANFDLTNVYDLAEDARLYHRPDPTDLKTRGQLWMFRNDLRGYVVLGDPAARLPQAEPKERTRLDKPVPVVTTAAGDSPTPITASTKEAAVLALVQGDETPRVIAQRAGCSLEQLFAWFETYRAMEREKLIG